ncbi:NCAIR mutase {PurE}-like protein [Geoglobus ahangari]|uniref:NCAIR mutase (PurE)-like protein n=1 Tax=Geoglobus ahangari TaxID=113653 RepID=A0A0F7IDD6_9EURY|nr:nickel pincer cofactor biosynthesis protein LarB [Geoglobus ahangari]AKG90940.1 NCAIR mutase {PurE}-like protein [Geoglobus ahangari]
MKEIEELLKKLDGKTISKIFLERLAEGINLDHMRHLRAGKPEAVLAEFKTVDEVVEIAKKCVSEKRPVLFTRVTAEQSTALSELGLAINERARTARHMRLEEESGKVAIFAAGTSDIPVAEEAKETAEFLGMEVLRFYDVGVAGIHRLIEPLEVLSKEDVDSVIVVAGMEGALPSVVAGLVDLPVIAVPTSVGYGTSLKGFTALFSMLQSCSSGVAVVNIDNGFGAAVFAHLISKRVRKKRL